MLERDFQKKRKIRNRIYSKTTIVALLLLAGVLGRAAWNMYQTKQQSANELARVVHEIASLNDKKQALVHDIAKLETQKGKEAEIRTKFSVSKEGETMVLLVEPEEKPNPVPEQVGFWAHTLSWFDDIF